MSTESGDRQEVAAGGERATRDNFMRMTGEPLRQFAHSVGIATSDAERMDDAKLRLQIRYALSRLYQE